MFDVQDSAVSFQCVICVNALTVAEIAQPIPLALSVSIPQIHPNNVPIRGVLNLRHHSPNNVLKCSKFFVSTRPSALCSVA